jgi:uncharacterized protein YbaR (Trm112 family)
MNKNQLLDLHLCHLCPDMDNHPIQLSTVHMGDYSNDNNLLICPGCGLVIQINEAGLISPWDRTGFKNEKENPS